MRDSNASTRQAQARTLPTAKHRGEEWGKGEVAMVAGFPEETAEELARALGRTVYAIHAIREKLEKGELEADGRRRRATEAQPFFTFAAGWRG